MAAANLSAGQVLTLGFAAGDDPAVAIGVGLLAKDLGSANQPLKVGLACIGIARGTLTARPTMAGHFGRIDAFQPYPFGAAADGIAVRHFGGSASNIGRRCR